MKSLSISVLSLFPQLSQTFFQTSLVGRAVEKGIICPSFISFTQFAAPGERVDAPVCGHGAGMLLKAEVVSKAINFAKKQDTKEIRVFFSPHGKKWNQKEAQKLALRIQREEIGHLIFVCGRYEGIDARVEEEADLLISLGEFVLFGGDIAALAVCETIFRFLPGIVGRQESVEKDSFSGALVDYPHYALPVDFDGKKVPEVLLSGHHARIDQWRRQKAAQRTLNSHWEWFRSSHPLPEETREIKYLIPPHHIIMNWCSPSLIKLLKEVYGVTGHQAVQAEVESTLSFIQSIYQEKILVIALGPSKSGGLSLDYSSQGKIWQQGRPIVFLVGVEMDKADYYLSYPQGLEGKKVEGEWIVPIVVDRWIGVSPNVQDI